MGLLWVLSFTSKVIGLRFCGENTPKGKNISTNYGTVVLSLFQPHGIGRTIVLVFSHGVQKVFPIPSLPLSLLHRHDGGRDTVKVHIPHTVVSQTTRDTSIGICRILVVVGRWNVTIGSSSLWSVGGGGWLFLFVRGALNPRKVIHWRWIDMGHGSAGASGHHDGGGSCSRRRLYPIGFVVFHVVIRSIVHASIHGGYFCSENEWRIDHGISMTAWRSFLLLPLGSIVHSTVEENFILVVVLLHVGQSIVTVTVTVAVMILIILVFFLPGVIG